MPTPIVIDDEIAAALERVQQATWWLCEYARQGRLGERTLGFVDGLPSADSRQTRAGATLAPRPAAAAANASTPRDR